METRRRRPATWPRAAAGRRALLGVLCAAAVALLRGRLLRVAVAGESMTPALRPGDWLLLRRGVPAPGRAAGAIVAARDPRTPQGAAARLLLKRVACAPAGAAPSSPGSLYLLGDQPAASTDSRHFGAVPRSAIAGTVLLRYWPPARFGPVAGPPPTEPGAAER